MIVYTQISNYQAHGSCGNITNNPLARVKRSGRGKMQDYVVLNFNKILL